MMLRLPSVVHHRCCIQCSFQDRQDGHQWSHHKRYLSMLHLHHCHYRLCIFGMWYTKPQSLHDGIHCSWLLLANEGLYLRHVRFWIPEWDCGRMCKMLCFQLLGIQKWHIQHLLHNWSWGQLLLMWLQQHPNYGQWVKLGLSFHVIISILKLCLLLLPWIIANSHWSLHGLHIQSIQGNLPWKGLSFLTSWLHSMTLWRQQRFCFTKGYKWRNLVRRFHHLWIPLFLEILRWVYFNMGCNSMIRYQQVRNS